MSDNKAIALGKKFLRWAGVPTVIDGLGFGSQTTRVATEAHPGGLWAVETGSTILVDVSANPGSGETLARLVKLRRSIAIYTAIVVALGIVTLSQLMLLNDVAGVWLLATLVAALFLVNRVAVHEESRRHVVEISTDPSSTKNGIAGQEAKDAASAGADLAHVMRQFATHEALMSSDIKNGLVDRASRAMRQELPAVTASTITDVTQDINHALGSIRRPQ